MVIASEAINGQSGVRHFPRDLPATEHIFNYRFAQTR